MAISNIKIPNKNFSAIFNKPLDNEIAKVKANYGSIVEEVATNSNIPSELLYAFILTLSNGINEKPWISVDKQTRSGLFSLSDKVGKEVLAREIKNNRMSEAERAFLVSAGDANLNQYIGSDRPAIANPNTWYSGVTTSNPANTGITATNKQLPINWQNAKTAIQVGAMWIGQVWDKIAEQSNEPLDKVILTIVLPYGMEIQKSTNRAFLSSNNLMSGAKLVMNRPYNTDYTENTTVQKNGKLFTTPKVWIGGGGAGTTKEMDANSIIIGYHEPPADRDLSNKSTTEFPNGYLTINNVRGGTPTSALKLIMSKGGILDKLLPK